MKKLGLFLIFLTTQTFLFSQEKGTLRHFQKKCDQCVVLPGSKFDDTKFSIFVPNTVYSGGVVTVKKTSIGQSKIKKMLVQFNDEQITQLTFVAKGKKNIAEIDLYFKSQFADFSTEAIQGEIKGASGDVIKFNKSKIGLKTNYNFQVIPKSIKIEG